MFQRQAREPFPARNILFLAAFVLGCLLFALKSTKQEVPLPAETPLQDTIRVDSLGE